ncbi:MAG: hypothetical protein ACN6PN_02800, partial [Sphingobacterium sp.]
MNSIQLPIKVDLETYCPTHKEQYRATCYAYAFAYTALTINYCVKNNITDRNLVEANAFSPGFIASRHRQQTNLNFFCGRKGSYDVDLRIFAQDGCPKLKDFPYDCTTNIPKEVFALAKQVELAKFEYLSVEHNSTEQNIQEIKFILSQKIPVLIVLNATDDFASIGKDCNEILP